MPLQLLLLPYYNYYCYPYRGLSDDIHIVVPNPRDLLLQGRAGTHPAATRWLDESNVKNPLADLAPQSLCSRTSVALPYDRDYHYYPYCNYYCCHHHHSRWDPPGRGALSPPWTLSQPVLW